MVKTQISAACEDTFEIWPYASNKPDVIHYTTAQSAGAVEYTDSTSAEG